VRKLFNFRAPPIHDILEWLLAVGDLLTVFTQTLVVGFMPLAVLGVLLIVEHMAVSDGVRFFTSDGNAIWLAAFAVVALNFCIEFWSVYADTREQDKRRRFITVKRMKPSLRLSLGALVYWLGISKKWKPQEEVASAQFMNLQKTITRVMLALALLGRMHDSISKFSQDVGWQQGITNLLTQSTLIDVGAWVGGVLLTYATVRGAQRLTYYNAIRVVDIRKRLKADANRKPQRRDASPKLVNVVDGYTEQRLRDNSLRPFRDGETYICPTCQKRMSKQGWSKHPCRFTSQFTPLDQSVDDDRPLVDVDGQPLVNLVNSRQRIGQVSVNGNNQVDNQ
jgi:uncharacterized protein YlaI